MPAPTRLRHTILGGDEGRRGAVAEVRAFVLDLPRAKQKTIRRAVTAGILWAGPTPGRPNSAQGVGPGKPKALTCLCAWDETGAILANPACPVHRWMQNPSNW